MRGRIVKGIAGAYYVDAGDMGLFECMAKGVFRKDGRKPLVGDMVELQVLDWKEKSGNIVELLPRHSELIRPAVANVDQAMVVFSIAKPSPNYNLLDRFLIYLSRQGLPCIICLNKLDLDQEGEGGRCRGIYQSCGYRVMTVSALLGQGMEELKGLLAGKVTAVAGPSGVGKSSVVNGLQQGIVMETGEISAKIERGRHTTRHSELIALGEGGYIVDTPGFSSLELFDLEKESLADCYPEFAFPAGNCRFGGCSHTKERDCGVKAAVEAGAISPLRYRNYCLFYGELASRQRKGRKAPEGRGNKEKGGNP